MMAVCGIYKVQVPERLSYLVKQGRPHLSCCFWILGRTAASGSNILALKALNQYTLEEAFSVRRMFGALGNLPAPSKPEAFGMEKLHCMHAMQPEELGNVPHCPNKRTHSVDTKNPA